MIPTIRMAMALTWARPSKRTTQPLTTAELTAKTKALTRETQNKKVPQGPKEPRQIDDWDGKTKSQRKNWKRRHK